MAITTDSMGNSQFHVVPLLPIYSTDLRGSSHYNLTNLYRMSKIDGMYLNTELSSLSALAVG